jgi:hypothetical protein
MSMTHASEAPQNTLLRLVLLAAIVGVAIFNGQGISSGRWSGPAFDFLSYWLTPYVRGTPFGTGIAPVYTTSVLLSLLTFVLSGAPAALYERVRRHHASTVVSLLIWLAVAALMTYPTYKAWQDAF